MHPMLNNSTLAGLLLEMYVWGEPTSQAPINVFRTNVLPNVRTSFLSPCASVIHVKEKLDKKTVNQCSRESNLLDNNTDELGVNVFQRTKDDEKVA